LSETEYLTFSEFLVNAPLYQKAEFSDEVIEYYADGHDENSRFKIRIKMSYFESVDVYCPECGKYSIFGLDYDGEDTSEPGGVYFYTIVYFCSRNSNHFLRFTLLIQEMFIQKIGQFPSLADLNSYDVKKYSKVLEKKYFQEFTKAIGLAAHGVGVGSFVYLRRIFEFLIEEAHQIAKSHLEWSEDLYCNARVNEKIGLLRIELPDFLVENTSMYSILSKGIHELSEQECLAAFPVMKLGIEMILDDKLAKREKEAKQAQATKAIQELHGKHSVKAK